MPDDFSTTPTLPPDAPSGSWLARNRRFAILGGVLLALIIISGVVAVIRGRAPASTSNSDNTSVTNESTGTPTDDRTRFRRYTVPTINDQDGDGLADEAETQAKTDPKIPDSDGDGLSDYEEVKIYKSNPTIQDTDKDGASDGLEVERGDNPLGPGKLRDLPTAIQQTKP